MKMNLENLDFKNKYLRAINNKVIEVLFCYCCIFGKQNVSVFYYFVKHETKFVAQRVLYQVQ